MIKCLKKLKNRIILLMLSLCVLLSLTGCSSATEKSYQSGVALLEQGRFEEASTQFRELGSYRDASLRLMYSRDALSAESGDYLTAHKAFAALGSFRDAQEMLRYYDCREVETSGRNALADGNFDTAVPMLIDAAGRYEALPAFRDTSQRAEGCLRALYSRGLSLLDEAGYDTANDLFSALGAFEESEKLSVYCKACLLETEEHYLEAAEQFLTIPEILDASARANTDRDLVYQKALHLSDAGDPEAAIALFSALGQYRDSEAQRVNMTQTLFQNRLQEGDYDGALFVMDFSPDAFILQQAEPELRQNFASFLDGFVQAYLHFSAGTIDSSVGYAGVVPFIERNGALDKRFRQVLIVGTYGHNTYFNYYGSDLLDLFHLDGNYYLAYVRASASVNQPVGPVQVTRTFRIVLCDTDTGPLAGSIEDCLYGEQNPTGRPVITGPLPGGELPPDEDGDGIILVDVMKKGFQGTMMIVLDPSRVFVGGPGFYGGNGMLLEDLVKRYDALGGINGGGFIDEGGGGTGGLPEGLTIVDGKSYLWKDSGASAAFDENNVLHVGTYTVESAAAAGIRDCVSFGPALIIDGAPEYGRHMESGINPRTAIGQREDGAVLMLCIDGRQIHSIGANYADLRDIMMDFGAVNACSLDGGSSTVMYFNGEYLNSPSSASGTSRYLPNAFLIKK